MRAYSKRLAAIWTMHQAASSKDCIQISEQQPGEYLLNVLLLFAFTVNYHLLCQNDQRRSKMFFCNNKEC